MDIGRFERVDEWEWRIPPAGRMRVPGVIFADQALVTAMDDKVGEQICNVACLPGIVDASFAMPDAHWGYGFPIGGVAAFDADEGGVISAGGVGFDISCGVRCLTTGLPASAVEACQARLADQLFSHIPAGLGGRGEILLDDDEMDAMLEGGARWAVRMGWGDPANLERIEGLGWIGGARPEFVSNRARERQRQEMGTLGSGNHYLEVQKVVEVFDAEAARIYGLRVGEVVVSIHCGSRGLGHQIGSEFLKRMAGAADSHDIDLPDRELACAPIRSVLGFEYLGAMRAAVNCALANREIISHLARQVFERVLPGSRLRLLYDVSHNTCREETHAVHGRRQPLFVHRKGATRAFGPGHPALPPALRPVGQPVLIGGSMGTESHVMAGCSDNDARAWASACHGAGRAMSRRQATQRWQGRRLVDDLATRGILVRSPSMRGVAEEAPGAYKCVGEVVDAAHGAGLARKVARLEPMVCIKG